MLVVISGPSGVGKDTVIARLRELDPGLVYSVSVTTRAPRAGEADGVNYRFVSDEQFRAMVEADEFLEWAEVHGRSYGTPRSRLEEARTQDVILKIDVQGAGRLREDQVEARYIFLLPPSSDELLRRLEGRSTDSAEAIARRQADAMGELAQADRYDHRVVNDNVDRAAGEILRILGRA